MPNCAHGSKSQVMLKFPVVPPDIEPPRPRRMSLREYADFSERCLRSNPAFTPGNCLTKRADEATMPPFRMSARHKPQGARS